MSLEPSTCPCLYMCDQYDGVLLYNDNQSQRRYEKKVTTTLQSISHPPLSTVLSSLRATAVGTPWLSHVLRISSHRGLCRYCRLPRLFTRAAVSDAVDEDEKKRLTSSRCQPRHVHPSKETAQTTH
jgi:hypothetical protein